MRISSLLLIVALFVPTLALAHETVEPAMIRIRPPGEGWVWIPPVYRTVWDWVWKDAVYRTVCERTWVPDEYGWQPEDVWENGQWVKRWNYVIIRPGHFETRTYRTQVSPGGWQYEARQEVVTPGHWEWRPTPPPWIEPPHPPYPAPVPPTTRPPELKPFSPLWEWPDSSKK